MTNIKVHVTNSDINTAIRKLRKRAEREGLIGEMRKREAFMKPSERRRMEHARALARKRKVAAKLFA